MRNRNFGVLVRIVSLVALTSAVLMATPNLELQLSSGGHVDTYTATGTFVQTPFSFNGLQVGSWNVSIAIGENQGTALSPSVTNPFILEEANTTTTGPASGSNSLTVSVSATGFTGTVAGAEQLLSQEVGFASAGTASFSVYYNTSDSLQSLPLSGSNQLLLSSAGNTGSYSNSQTGSVADPPLSANPAGPYTLTLVAVLTQSAAGANNFELSESVVPEPGFYGLLALGLGGLFLAVQSRRKAVTKV